MKRNIDTLRDYYNQEMKPMCNIDFELLTEEDLKTIESTSLYSSYCLHAAFNRFKVDVKKHLGIVEKYNPKAADQCLDEMDKALKRLNRTNKVAYAIILSLLALQLINIIISQ